MTENIIELAIFVETLSVQTVRGSVHGFTTRRCTEGFTNTHVEIPVHRTPTFVIRNYTMLQIS